ncbi:glycosyltransferase family 2 protein [Salinibius halmophilus]|uniref:glycosyltransferase family 2 protein n=1 Tax=Salinibius halmophilus TaxID=1853216 RepID=UPI0013143A1A|nr:glycosyltransferase [Salinibius halmophilus]
MKVSIVALSWNSESYIQEFLKSLLLSKSDIKEVIIIDNGSSDKTTDLIRCFRGNNPSFYVELICLDKNYGTTMPRNLGLKKCTGDYIAILDSDIILHEGVLNHLITKLINDSSIGIIAPVLFYKNGRQQLSFDRFPSVGHKVYRYFNLRKMEDKINSTQSSKLAQVDYLISAFWLMPKKTILYVGFLDENFFYAPEDVDFCKRVWDAGLSVNIDYTASSTHDAQEISRNFKFNKAFREHVKGLAYYFLKHKYLFKAPKRKSST